MKPVFYIIGESALKLLKFLSDTTLNDSGAHTIRLNQPGIDFILTISYSLDCGIDLFINFFKIGRKVNRRYRTYCLL